MKSFFREAIGSIKTSGTVKPSSKHLINGCLNDLEFDQLKTVVEFGAGNGCITQEIANRIKPNAQLYSFEINPKFYHYCLKNFEANNNVHIVNESAVEFDTVLKEVDAKVDCFISSLPLTLLKQSEIDTLLAKVKKHLVPGGVFIQYQYSLGNYRQLKNTFDEVNINLTIRNLPPAFIYKCQS